MRDTQWFDRFDSELQCQWKRDRAMRQRVPLSQAWRGCIGLAAMVDDFDRTAVCHGTRVLLPNDALTWICLRDVPVGRFRGSFAMSRREVSFANVAKASLRYGLPALHFTAPLRPGWDFRFLPFASSCQSRGGEGGVGIGTCGDVLNGDQHPREFAVLNHLSERMTRFAFCGVESNGRPVRRPWALRRPPESPDVFQVHQPHDWMPRAYLSFPLAAAERLFKHSTEGDRGTLKSSTCYGCRAGGLGQVLFAGALGGSTFRRFAAAVEEGLPLRAPEPLTYLGRVKSRSTTIGVERLQLVDHQLRSRIDGRISTVRLPVTARVLVPPLGRTTEPKESDLEPGTMWCQAVSGHQSSGRRCRHRAQQLDAMYQTCGGSGMLAYLHRVWLSSQWLRLAESPDHVLLPARLASAIARDVRPEGLWWDVTGCERCLHADLETFLFPPLRIHRWDRLRLSLPSDVDLDAGIADPRLDASSTRSGVDRSVRRRRAQRTAHEGRLVIPPPSPRLHEGICLALAV